MTRHRRIIAIIDDCAEDREASRRALSSGDPACFFLEEAAATEGLALCRSAAIDCLLLDYSLPDMDGLEFLNELTEGFGVSPFPVIMLTGCGSESVAVQAIKRGATDYLVKGQFRPETLLAAVERAMEHQAARDRREEQRRSLERLEAEARLRADRLAEADRRKDEFLAMLAHELRNPLAPVANALYLLRRTDAMPAEASRMIEVADRQVKHLVRLVDDLMEVSRITRGKVALKLEIVEFGAIVRQAADAARPAIDARQHDLSLDIPADPVYLPADPTRLEQVLVNLLNNAAKYTDPGGRISVVVVRGDAEVVVRVVDTGVGIDAETLPRVFDLFAQADRSLDRASGGLGIGLTLVRALVEQHGGSVMARSDGPGSGSEFVVRLPVGEASDPASGRGPAEAEGRAPLRVLVVDDNVDGAEMFAMLFRASGYEVHLVHDGRSGLEAVGRLRPDAVLLDIGLPRMDGYEVARTIRSEFGGDDGPFLIAITGYSHPDDRRRGEEAGFHCYLVKPIDPEELLRVVAECRGRVNSRPKPAPVALPIAPPTTLRL